MICQYKKRYTITTNMLDANDNLRLAGIFDISQRIAGEHAEIIGCGFNKMIEQNLIWVVTKHYIEFSRPVKDSDNIDVLTYPLKPRIIEFCRENEFSINDEVVAHSTSSWMVYNIKTNSIDRCSAFENLEFHEQFFKERVKRLPHLKKDALEFYKNVEVTYSMIDHNKHMNNTHYFDFFLDAFAPEKPIQIAQIEYLNQAYLGNIIELFKYKDGEFDELYGFIGENPIFHLRVKYF